MSIPFQAIISRGSRVLKLRCSLVNIDAFVTVKATFYNTAVRHDGADDELIRAPMEVGLISLYYAEFTVRPVDAKTQVIVTISDASPTDRK